MKLAVQRHYLEHIPYEQFKNMRAAELARLVKGRIQGTIDKYA